MTPVLRRLTAADAGHMASLERECFSLPWSEEQCRRAFAQKAFAAFGLQDQQELFAYVSLYHAVPEMEIINLAVRASLRRQGLGTRLLATVLQVARKMGIQRVLLEVRRGNLPAIALYESAGFREQGIRKHYYPDTGEDALVYAIEYKRRTAPKEDPCRK